RARGRLAHAGVHGGRGGMVLVDHQPVVAGLIRELVLVQIARVVRGRLAAIEEPVRKTQTQRRILVAFLVRPLVVRHLAEVVELHRGVSPRKSSTRRAKCSGCSSGGRCPQRPSTVSVAFGMTRRYCSPHSTGTIRSSPPQMTSVRFVTRGKKCASRGLCM